MSEGRHACPEDPWTDGPIIVGSGSGTPKLPSPPEDPSPREDGYPSKGPEDWGGYRGPSTWPSDGTMGRDMGVEKGEGRGKGVVVWGGSDDGDWSPGVGEDGSGDSVPLGRKPNPLARSG